VKVFGITGWKNSGKTTLVTRLVGHLTARGLRVATIKHAHLGFDLDVEGKDSYLHREAGAAEVLVSSARRWALMHELRGEEEVSLELLLARLAPADLVLVEGYKRDPHLKLQVIRSPNAEPPPELDNVVAFATDTPAAMPADVAGRPVFHLDDVAGIAAFVLRRMGLPPVKENRARRRPGDASSGARRGPS